jgi:hypothetical protein
MSATSVATRMPRAALIALCLMLFALPQALAVDVSNLAAIESDPCFQQAHGRALDNHLPVIESQIVTACTEAHGNPTDAMVILTAMAAAPPWLPPASGGMTATSVLIAVLAELLVLATLLGVDIGYASRALGLPAPSVGVSAATIAARLVAALALTALAEVPGLTILAAAVLLFFAVRASRWRGPRLAQPLRDEAPRPLAGGLASLGTDLLGNLPVLIGISAVSRASLALAAVGVLAAAAAARLLHPMLARSLMRHPWLTRSSGALIAAVAGFAAMSDTIFSDVGPMPTPVLVLIPLVLAGLVAIAGKRLTGGAPEHPQARAPMAGE